MTWKIGLVVVVCLPHFGCAASSSASSRDGAAVRLESARVTLAPEPPERTDIFKTTLMAGRPLRQDIPPSLQLTRKR